MAVNDLRELLKHDLGDLLFAEKTILKALKKMTREVSNPEMRARMEQHYTETEQQIGNLEQAFQAMGEKAKAQKCPGILGIIQEHDEFKSDEEPSKPILEAFDLGSGLRVEHYEISAYRSAMAVARALGEREVMALLKQNLEQELAMAKFIETSAASALAMVQSQTAGASMGGTAKGGARKGGAAKSGAAKGGARGASRGGAKGGARQQQQEMAAAE